jgi:Family of unknown function (DUF6191)
LGGGLGESLVDLASIFEPGNAHLAAERRRQKTNRRQAANGSPPFELDLDTGGGRFSGTYRLGPVDDASEPPESSEPAGAVESVGDSASPQPAPAPPAAAD